ncbi:hypothetical protein [Rothia halotolerans]|nr:hypothetical protein [Rothia halotolerans]
MNRPHPHPRYEAPELDYPLPEAEENVAPAGASLLGYWGEAH